MGKKTRTALAALAVFFLAACSSSQSVYEGIASEFSNAFDDFGAFNLNDGGDTNGTDYEFTIKGTISAHLMFCESTEYANALVQAIQEINNLTANNITESKYGTFTQDYLNVVKFYCYNSANLVFYAAGFTNPSDFNRYKDGLETIIKDKKIPSKKNSTIDPDKYSELVAKTAASLEESMKSLVNESLASYENVISGYEKDLSLTSFEDLKEIKDVKAPLYQERLDAINVRVALIEEGVAKAVEAKSVEIASLFAKAESSLVQKDLDDAKAAYQSLNKSHYSEKLNEWDAKVSAVQKKINEKTIQLNISDVAKLLTKAESSLTQADLDTAIEKYEDLSEADYASKLLEWKTKASTIQKKINDKITAAKTAEIAKLLSKAESSLVQKDLNDAYSAYKDLDETLYLEKKKEWDRKVDAIQLKIDTKPTILGAGTFLCSDDIKPARYHITVKSGSGNFVVRKDSSLLINEILSATSGHGIMSFDSNITQGCEIKISGLNQVIFTPVVKRPAKTSLSAGFWSGGDDIETGSYYAKATGSNSSGNFIVYDVSGKLKVNEILSTRSGHGVESVACRIEYGDIISISGLNSVKFEAR